MFPNNMEFMTGEHRQDLRQEAEQMRLIKAAGLQQSDYGLVVRKVTEWLGSQLIKWGAKLHSYGTAPSPEVVSTKVTNVG